MILNSVYVYIDVAIDMGLKLLLRCLDKGFGSSCFCCCKNKKTSKVTILRYSNLYSGPEHLMHFRYATILNTVFITFFYGMALPLLFPIAAFTFLNLYVVDKLAITYYYQEPPKYGIKLSKYALKWLKKAPLFMFFFGYWVMGQP